MENLLDNVLSEQRIVLFIRGTPMYPECGQSASSVLILRALDKDYKYFNILEQPTLYEELEKLTGSKDIPQLFVNKKLVGAGNDIRKLFESGELELILKL